jgi:riboflavin-specific deaminase-like protein
MFVFSNLATSIDGKIATASRELLHLGTPADRRQMQVLRKRCDILLMGAGTLRAHHRFCGVRGAPSDRQPANAIVSEALGGISPDWPFFQDPRLKRFLFLATPQKLSAARRKAFERSSEIIELQRSGKGRPVAAQIIEALKKHGYKRLLVEGGGEIMWHFAGHNLIDEYNVTLTPKIVGGSEAPTLVEGKGFQPSEILTLKLHRCKRLGNELYLVYRKRGS